MRRTCWTALVGIGGELYRARTESADSVLKSLTRINADRRISRSTRIFQEIREHPRESAVRTCFKVGSTKGLGGLGFLLQTQLCAFVHFDELFHAFHVDIGEVHDIAPLLDDFY